MAVLGINACALTEGDEEEVEQASTVEPDAEAVAQEESADEDADDEDAPAAGTGEDATPDPDEAIQTVTYDMTGPTEGEMTMALQGLEVSDEGMLVTVTFTPEYEQDGDPAHFVRDMHDPAYENITEYLLPVVSDRANLKAYHVPREQQMNYGGGWFPSAAQAWASSVNVNVHSGDTLTMWAYVPTPEDDIDTVDVAVTPGAPEFRDVEIEWDDHSPADHGGEDEAAEDDDE